MPLLLLTEQEIRDSVDMAGAIDVVEKAFEALGRGQVTQPPPIGLDIPDIDAEIHVKGAHIHGSDHFVFKVACGFYRNPQIGLPMASGLVLVFDANNGQPAGLLFDNSYLSDLRTGAAGGVVARYLAPQEIRRVAVIGAGGRMGGNQIESSPGEKRQIEVGRIKKLRQPNGLVVIRLECLQFRLRQFKNFVWEIGVPFADLFCGQFSVVGTALPLLNPLAATGVNLAEMALLCRDACRKRFDRYLVIEHGELTRPTRAAGGTPAFRVVGASWKRKNESVMAWHTLFLSHEKIVSKV